MCTTYTIVFKYDITIFCQYAEYKVTLPEIAITTRVTGITFIRYTQSRKVGKPNNLKIYI
jgi:hypothetical protein